VFFSTSADFSARADAAAMARLDGVFAYEGTRPAAATLPRCGSGCVPARAGKALDARAAPAFATAQCVDGGAAVACGPTGCAAHPGKPVQTAAIRSGMFIVTSIDSPF
jgi:hypothetical protein